MEQSINAYRVLLGKLEGRRHLGRPRHRWEENIKMYLREMGCDPGEWIGLAELHALYSSPNIIRSVKSRD